MAASYCSRGMPTLETVVPFRRILDVPYLFMRLHTDHRRVSSRLGLGYLLTILIDHLPILARHFRRPWNW